MMNLEDGRQQTGIWHTQTDDHMLDTESLNLLEESSGLQDWIIPATFSAIFCFFPTGIVAIISALKARKSKANKDRKSWKKYTGRARFFVFLTLLLGVIMYGVVIGVLHSVTHNDDVT